MMTSCVLGGDRHGVVGMSEGVGGDCLPLTRWMTRPRGAGGAGRESLPPTSLARRSSLSSTLTAIPTCNTCVYRHTRAKCGTGVSGGYRGEWGTGSQG